MKKLILTLVSGFLVVSASAAWQAGSGLANDRAVGTNDRDVTFVQRGGGADYGWRQYSLPLGLTVLPWSVPNFECSVYGLRLNLGWGGYDGTYGLDAGVFSSSRSFGGIAANGLGNYVTGEAAGIEVGAVNVAGVMKGLQIGFVNFADNLGGAQIGVLNFNRAGITFPIINFGW